MEWIGNCAFHVTCRRRAAHSWLLRQGGEIGRGRGLDGTLGDAYIVFEVVVASVCSVNYALCTRIDNDDANDWMGPIRTATAFQSK